MISRRVFLTGAAAAATSSVGTAALASGIAQAAPTTCQLALHNASLAGTVRAYVTGHEQPTGAWMLLRADGSVYRPSSPSAPQIPLPVDCSIPLGPAGSPATVLTLPQMYGARIYFGAR
ncbi:hypothetical protein GCM10022206_15010 [Streptomyces chiangmaiensis]